MDCSAVTTCVIPNAKLYFHDGELLSDPSTYRSMYGGWSPVLYSDSPGDFVCSWKGINAGDVTDRRSTIGFCPFFGDSQLSCKSKKETVLARSSAEAEYRALADTTSKIILL